MDWQRFEAAWFDAVIDAISATANANTRERFYAGAFWLLYGDGSKIAAPAFGMSSEAVDPGVRWHPPDWRWDIIHTAHERVALLYEPLLSLTVSDERFEQLWEQHIDMLARVCRRATAAVRTTAVVAPASAFTPGFFVGIIDFAQGDAALDYLRRSVDSDTLAVCGVLTFDQDS